MKTYNGKKYAHLNTVSKGTKFVVLHVNGSNILIMSTDRNNYKRLINRTVNNSGSIVMYDTSESVDYGIKEFEPRRWCCDSWAIPNKAMQSFLNDNQVELLGLLERSA